MEQKEAIGRPIGRKTPDNRSLQSAYLRKMPVSPSWTLILLYAYQFSSFYKFTSLNIHNSFTLSLPAQNVPLSQVLPTIGPLSFSQTDTTDSGCSPFLAFPVLVSVPCGRLSWFLRAFDCSLISHCYLLTYLLYFLLEEHTG